MFGSLTGWLGSLFDPSTRGAVGLVLGSYLLGGTILRARPWPDLDRATPQSLLELGPYSWAFANGYLLGFGPVSRIGFWTWPLVPISSFLVGSAGGGIAVWAVFGFVRLAILVVFAGVSADKTDLLDLSARLLSARSWVEIKCRYFAAIGSTILIVVVV